jgi:uroporphyrinogen III methyltransferase / synthase
VALGRVFLVGAGPGDPELITQKGLRLLQIADVILYDHLVHPNLLNYAKKSAVLESVGKQKGQHSHQQAYINQAMISYAKQGLCVVRLKGGDPTVFGRGGEEMQVLREAGIAYEVVPGVSSIFAVPAYAGIPVTHRDKSRSVAFVTGTLQSGEAIEEVQLPDADTLIFLMSVTHLEQLATLLQSRPRFSASTPAALIYQGTTAHQQTVMGTLATISQLQKEAHLEAPSLLIVGEVVSLRESLSWWEKLPLQGLRVVVLRAIQQNQDLVHALTALGAEVIQLPMLDFNPLKAGYAACISDLLADQTMIIFTSPNGVHHFINALSEKKLDSRSLAGKQVIAIGPSTEKSLKEKGIIPTLVPQKYDSEGILDSLPHVLSDEKILIPTALESRDSLQKELEARGAKVEVLRLYETVCPPLPSNCIIENNDIVIFTSPSTATHFFESKVFQNQRLYSVCMGLPTKARVEEFITERVFLSESASVDDLVKKIQEIGQKLVSGNFPSTT